MDNNQTISSKKRSYTSWYDSLEHRKEVIKKSEKKRRDSLNMQIDSLRDLLFVDAQPRTKHQILQAAIDYITANKKAKTNLWTSPSINRSPSDSNYDSDNSTSNDSNSESGSDMHKDSDNDININTTQNPTATNPNHIQRHVLPTTCTTDSIDSVNMNITHNNHNNSNKTNVCSSSLANPTPRVPEVLPPIRQLIDQCHMDHQQQLTLRVLATQFFQNQQMQQQLKQQLSHQPLQPQPQQSPPQRQSPSSFTPSTQPAGQH